MEIIDQKICCRCKEKKSLDQYHYNKIKQKHVSACKICVCNNTRKWLKELSESNNETDILKSTVIKMLQTTGSNAKTKKLEFNLTRKSVIDQYNKQNGKCYYTGTPMSLRTNNHLNRDPLLISLDRKNSNKGYTNDNIVLCCYGINALKGWHTEEVLYNVLKIFYENSKGIGKI